MRTLKIWLIVLGTLLGMLGAFEAVHLLVSNTDLMSAMRALMLMLFSAGILSATLWLIGKVEKS